MIWARAAIISGILMVFAAIHSAFAYQQATTISDLVPVHQFANATSPVLATLPMGRTFLVSSGMIRDIHGEYWYKVQLPSKEFGYIHASNVITEDLVKSLKDAGVQPDPAEREFARKSPTAVISPKP